MHHEDFQQKHPKLGIADHGIVSTELPHKSASSHSGTHGGIGHP